MSQGFIAEKHINMSCMQDNAAKKRMPTRTCSHPFWGYGMSAPESIIRAEICSANAVANRLLI